ncbi:hypothetical protein Hdeb2414_s0002g00051651 [Helianthus debilis subsp. tardiflorus]
MGALKGLAVSYLRLTQEEVETFCMEWGIGRNFKPVAPGMDGLARVLHFEVLCRACGYDPTLLSFRRFFQLAKKGDWFTFETSKADICLVSSMVTTLGAWMDRFFWVSDEILPFKMVWRRPEAILNEPEPSASEINTHFFEIIRECPSRVRPFPEQLLVLLGICKLWDKPNREPVLMRDGQVMSTLEFIKSDDTSDVAFGDVQATPGENLVVKDSEQRFEGSDYVGVSDVKGFKKAIVPKVVRRSNHRLNTSCPPSTLEHVDLSDDIGVSVDHALDEGVDKEKELVIAMKKSVGKGVVVAGSSGKSVSGSEGLDVHQIYVPDWGVKLGDSFKDAAVCEDVLATLLLPWFMGYVAGYKACQSGDSQDKSSLYRPEALHVFHDSVREMERLTYPYVGEVSKCFGKPISILQDLKPRGLDEAVCKEVLGSLSKKRSCSGDSEDTLSCTGQGSKDPSLEASGTAVEEGKKKKKKKKKS